LVSIALAALSLIEAPRLVLETGLSDKTLHTLGYVVQAATLLWAFWRSSALPKSRAAAITFAYTVLLGGALELLQAWCTRTRSGEWLDLAADAIGALVGIGLTALLLHLTDKKHLCNRN
jgi:VanZ family protein